MASVIQLKQQQKIYLLISLYDVYQELLNKHRRRMIYRLFESFFASIRWVTNPVPESPVEKMICHLLIIHLWGLFILGWESWGFKQLRCYGQRNTLIFILVGNRMESLILSIFVQIQLSDSEIRYFCLKWWILKGKKAIFLPCKVSQLNQLDPSNESGSVCHWPAARWHWQRRTDGPKKQQADESRELS